MEERLQKILAAAGIASRREAEKIILAGRVKVNGKLIKELGAKFGSKAFITVDGKPIKNELVRKGTPIIPIFLSMSCLPHAVKMVPLVLIID